MFRVASPVSGDGRSGATLVSGAVNLASCTRCTAVEIEEFVAGLGPG